MNPSMLRELYRQPGPWVSVYLDTSLAAAQAREAIAVRWRDVADEVTAAGAGAAVVEALARSVREHNGAAREGLALFAGTDARVHAYPLPEPPPLPVGRVGELPAVLPLLVGFGERVRWLRVLVDRTGADRYDSGHLHRTADGSARYPVRHRRAAEEGGERTAKDVAERLIELVEATGPDVVVVAGDVHARRLLLEHLPPAVATRVVETSAGSRAPGADPGPLDEATERAVRTVVERRCADTLDACRAGLAHGYAVAGLNAIRTPLAWAQVETLLLNPGVPGEVADELVAAAVPGDAEVLVVAPERQELPDGVGAVLRYRLVEGER